ncbi:SET domain-containing protein-lysine N-methyltransferase [Acidovorax sp.]|uniref:SET domain-containing protein-lysine N-methyltransferase n=1 Tax=Acidovorax sp. TaxID=1872122 RepID=UPI002630755C|nr:SET domain-containing protein-lysine N-methyltransferase [Acidovorax sp.]HQT19416.1 SET domain-containing protein-lysine N-methyltransferase [Acidovorax defluvii]HQT51125.1 SET domain-containing protein-lysine N-methyltransferase [Acidovorax defluvii]
MIVKYGRGFVKPQETLAEKVDLLESEFLKHPQADCPVTHHFGPGIYIREVRVPAGAYAIGHRQRCEHMNVFLRGRVTVTNDDGSHTELVAPMTFVGNPGRKIGYVHEDMVWQNIYATDETDIETLEAMFLEKSEGWQAAQAAVSALPLLDFAGDRADYSLVLESYGFTEEVARSQSEDVSDQTPFPHGSYCVLVSDSKIEGKGLFATADFSAGQTIAPARIGGKRTPAGRFTNHSKSPNAVMVMRGSDISLVALKPIKGCTGGDLGDEITIDYRAALGLQITPKEGF